MKKFLRVLAYDIWVLMRPWRIRNRLLACMVYSVWLVVLSAVLGLVDHRFGILFYVSLGLYIPLASAMAIQSFGSTKAKMKAARSISGIVSGDIALHDLPPEVQEEIKIAVASVILERS